MVEPEVLDSDSIYLEIKNIVGDAKTQVLIVSPFINKRLLEDLLKLVDENVLVTLITRFRPIDLLGGLNDLAIYDICKRNQNLSLRLLHELHAKYYRGDSKVILGSGNLTFKGLPQWGNGNAEVMVKLDGSTKGISEFEENLIDQSMVPGDDLIDQLRKELIELRRAKKEDNALIEMARENLVSENVTWMPQCNMPNCIFEVYCGRVSEIDNEIVNQAREDLNYLALPRDLEKDSFNSCVRIALEQTKVISMVIAKFKDNHEINVSTLREIVTKAFEKDPPANIDEIWKRYLNWLHVFFDGFTKVR